MKRAAILVLFSLAVSGCERTVETAEAGGTGQGGSSSSVGASTSSKAVSSSTGSGECMGWIDLVVDGGAPVHWTSICFGSWGAMYSDTAVGFAFSGGPSPGIDAFVIQGCENGGDLVVSPGIEFAANQVKNPGTYTDGTTGYTDEMGQGWGQPGDAFSLTITKLEPVGGVVEGSFKGFVSHGGNAAHDIAATFHVCRVDDALVP